MTSSDDKDKPTRDWDAGQVERDTGETPDQRDAAVREHAAKAERPRWDKGQMAEDSGTGRHGEPIGEDAMKEGESPLSGDRTNPGGGERWAERDRPD